MDEELAETNVPTVGERLRAAREAKGVSLEEIAAQTRIPRRHLESLEASDWDKLPAPTYTIGFAKNYASAVGLDRAEIGDQLRSEMGRERIVPAAEVFEPVDPARTMPKWLVLGAVGAVIVIALLLSWLNQRSLEEPDAVAAIQAAPAAGPVQQPPAATPVPVSAQGPVALTATEEVWLQVYERGGASLFQGTLQPGQTFQVPATAAAPLLKTGKPEALRVTVGSAVAPPLGPAATTVSDVSLLPADLMRAGQASAGAAAPLPAPPPRTEPRRATQSPPAAPEPAPAAPAGEAVTNAAG